MKRHYMDLTYAIDNRSYVYPGDPQVNISTATTIADKGYKVSKLEFGSHQGTHVDAPSHMIEGGKTLSNFGPDKFMGEAIYIIQSHELKDSEIVLTNEIRIDGDFLHRLIDFMPKMVGFADESYLPLPSIKKLLEHEILPVGPLKYDLMPRDPFYFSAQPLNLKNGDGSPVRAIAWRDLD